MEDFEALNWTKISCFNLNKSKQEDFEISVPTSISHLKFELIKRSREVLMVVDWLLCQHIRVFCILKTHAAFRGISICNLLLDSYTRYPNFRIQILLYTCVRACPRGYMRYIEFNVNLILKLQTKLIYGPDLYSVRRSHILLWHLILKKFKICVYMLLIDYILKTDVKYVRT